MTEPEYPLIAIRFQVDWGGSFTNFAEVSGLNVETDIVEYRGGPEESLTTRKIPGLMKYSNVTLKRGIVPAGNDLFDWWTKNQRGERETRRVTIRLLDETGRKTVTWIMEGAWPVKVEGPCLNGTANDVVIELLEFCHEGLTIQNG